MFFLFFIISIFLIQLDCDLEFFLIFFFWRNYLFSEIIYSYVLFYKIRIKDNEKRFFLSYTFINFFWKHLLKINFIWQPLFKKNSYYTYFRNNREFWINYKLKK